MSKDIANILKDWSYDPGNISARWIKGDDGRRLVQLRLDLGLFQMEENGRPDGKMPRGFDSVLDYYRSQEKLDQESAALSLNFEACAELQQEAMQYYYRYLAFYALHHLDGVIRDTEHNLGILDLVDCYAEDDDLAWQFMQFFPYVCMMNARAQAEKLVENRRFEEAVEILEAAMADIQEFWNEHGEYEMGEESHEVEIIRNLLTQVRSKRPKTRKDQLQEELQEAIAIENYEKAAMLRDELSRLQMPLAKPPTKPRERKKPEK